MVVTYKGVGIKFQYREVIHFMNLYREHLNLVK